MLWTTHDLWPLSGGCVLYSGCDRYRGRLWSLSHIIPRGKELGEDRAEDESRSLSEKRRFGQCQQPVDGGPHSENHEYSEVSGEVPVIPPIVDPVLFRHRV